jgi:galactokinase
VNNPRDLATRGFAARFGDSSTAREWFVPGRIEVLGKHVDYAGGRSLLAAIDRGFHVVARPRQDNRVHLVDARSGQSFLGTLQPDAPQAPGTWSDYVITVLRRIARDFPDACRGMDAVLASNLPSAAGVSSSSALVIATFLPLAAFNRLEDTAQWAEHLSQRADLAGYLGAMENGKRFGPFPGDFGVGTAGGSQDHLAILCCRAGHLTQARFLPAAVESEVAFPSEWTFVIASCGVAAPKGGAVQGHYNALAAETRAILDAWNAESSDQAVSLLDVLAIDPAASRRLRRLLEQAPDAPALLARLTQFETETMTLIPAAMDAVRRHDGVSLGSAVDRSHAMAVSVLANQVAETRHLADRARTLGALAASAFGAGFGGSVYAIVPNAEAKAFAAAWAADYREAFPAAGVRAEFFQSDPADGARPIDHR